MKEMIRARKAELQKRGVKGFTLMEMLIVVAIIAILIAIAIPIFTSQLDNAKVQTDAANERSAKAVAAATYLTSDDPKSTVKTYRFDNATGTLVDADDDDAYTGQSTTNSGKYLTVKITTTGSIETTWA